MAEARSYIRRPSSANSSGSASGLVRDRKMTTTICSPPVHAPGRCGISMNPAVTGLDSRLDEAVARGHSTGEGDAGIEAALHEAHEPGARVLAGEVEPPQAGSQDRAVTGQLARSRAAETRRG